MSENEIGIEQARKELGPLADAAYHHGEITILTRHGRQLAAIVPISLIPPEPVMTVTLFETNSDVLVIARGDNAWSLHLAGDHMEGMFAQDAEAWIGGDWEPNENDGQNPTTLDDITPVATWNTENGLTVITDPDQLGGAARIYIGTEKELPTLAEGTHSTVLTGRDVVTGGTIYRIIVWADRPYDSCPRCEQTVGYEVDDCPVMLNTGAGQGGAIVEWSKQHGCGEWLSVSWRQASNAGAVEAAARDLAAALAEDIEDLRGKTRETLTKQLRAAITRLAEPLDEAAGETTEDREEDVLSGSEVTPGVYRDGDVLLAWDYDPAGRNEEGIAVNSQDLEG